jgi:hypothetical protein
MVGSMVGWERTGNFGLRSGVKPGTYCVQ